MHAGISKEVVASIWLVNVNVCFLFFFSSEWIEVFVGGLYYYSGTLVFQIVR